MEIYISNPGFVCSCGKSPEEFMKNLTSGNQNGISKARCDLVCENSDREFFVGKIQDEMLNSVEDKFATRFLQVLDTALDGVRSAVEKAVAKYGAERVAVCVGQCDNGSYLSFTNHKEFFTKGEFPADYDLKAQGADYPATYISKKFGLNGVSLSFATACSSSASAIIKGKELIKAGIADAVVAGGGDVDSDTVLLGFDSLEAVSHEKANPFSKNRSGITLGEGASFFVLSKDDIDGTGIVLAGTGESSDANHMTAPLADGSGAKQAMESALKDAGLEPSEIDYVNLHGTGTHLNDSMEGKGVDLVFGDYKVPCSTIKSMTGHTLGGAASLELAACFYAIKMQKLPVQAWDKVQDEEIPVLNIVSDSDCCKDKEIKICMSNSFAFGGCNASLIIKKA
ncbi:MAG: 3-oxoacyl-ACP synthase [Treponema sp.]|nr:3-oxoacyl-ACP synthase [Candidatus Treponema equifaecale]